MLHKNNHHHHHHHQKGGVEHLTLLSHVLEVLRKMCFTGGSYLVFIYLFLACNYLANYKYIHTIACEAKKRFLK